MKYNLAFKYRIYPNKDQELLINKTFGCVRFVYNTILYTANKFYKETGKNKIITPASLKSENQFLKEVDSLALSNAQLNVRRSFTNFFRKERSFQSSNLKRIIDLFDNLNFLFPQGVLTPCFRIFILLNFRSFRTSLMLKVTRQIV
ncbi:putative transposase [Leptotrichia wadei]|uniref:Putative transposase n=1 Tax=Leptotrichia wadei TaxID=157687 RepID=A0A510KRJ5_9FUSO|nr:helix-turn-helix domain-containing protein [Leptotrichia wadei]BBM54359.1 putative transposase [Leptotrichia wadei]